MKPVRLVLSVIIALVALLAIAALVAFNARFQTWAVRRVFAGRPALGITLGSVSAGLSRVDVRDLRVESHGAVLTVPSLEIDLPLTAAGLGHKVAVTRLVAKGWTLDLTKAPKLADTFTLPSGLLGARSPSDGKLGAAEFSLLSLARAADPAATVAPIFQGVFAQLALPIDLACDGADLAGEVILPEAHGHARVTFTGGGLGMGHDARFELAATFALTSSSVSTVEAHADFTATMDTPSTFTRLGAKADATASGPQFPRGVKISANASAARATLGESYSLALATSDKQLIDVKASYPPGARKLSGGWKVDVRDTDVAPFLLGRTLPAFAANGEGQVDFDGASAELHANGKLQATSENLAAVRSELGAFGALHVVAEFDLTQKGDTTRVDRLATAISGTQPVAKIDSLQTLTYNRATHGVAGVDPSRDLFSVTLQGVPLAWVQPFAKGIIVSGGDLKGEFTATASDGGFSLRPKAPLTATGISVAQAGKPLLRGVDLSLNPSVDYTPHGWQLSAAPLQLKSGAATLLTIEAKAGQLVGADQPIKAAGKLSASIPALLAQPLASGALQFTRGDLVGEFLASLGTTQEIQAKLGLTNLEADPKLVADKLPSISTEVRADIAAGGQVTFNAPLLVERDGRKSDLALAGTLTPGPAGLTVAARVSSAKLVVDDVKILAAPLAPAPASTAPADTKPAVESPRESGPPWAGVSGQVALALKEVVYTGTFQLSDVTGTLRLEAGAAKLEGVRVGLGNGSDAKLSGAVTFDPKATTPYSLNADLAVSDFDPSGLFKAINPGQPATVEGKFNVTSKLAGTAAHLGEFATTTRGDFQLSSKGGVFHGLPVTVASKNETVGKLASGVATLSGALDIFQGRKDDSDVTSKAKAVAEISKLFAAIQYDQLSVNITRDTALNTVLKDFTLISPEMRLTGGGTATHQTGKPLLDEALAMEFKLRARGHTGDLLKYLGKLEAQVDELGYAACTLPLKVGGTIGKPDASAITDALTAVLLEKSGVKDKAGDLLNKLLGK